MADNITNSGRLGDSVMLRDMAQNKIGVSVVGAGSLAQALAVILPEKCYSIREIATRANSRGWKAAKRIAKASGAACVTIENAKWSGEIVWLVVSDKAIAECAATLEPLANWKNKIVFHSSGALSSDVLAPLRRRGAHVASVHPMMTFVKGRRPDMQSVVWTVEGDPKAVAQARDLVKSLKGNTVQISKADKALYHATGAFLSPLLVVHLETAARLARTVGIPAKAMSALVRPIVSQTLENLLSNIGQKGGAGRAFSGPLIRGDIETLQMHLKALRRDKAARELYLALLRAALESDLPVKNRESVKKLLRDFWLTGSALKTGGPSFRA